MKRLKYLLLASLVAFAACDEETLVPVVETGTVNVMVTAGGAGVAGVTVSLGAAGTTAQTTDASGNASFTNVSEGSYVVTISGLSADIVCSSATQPVTVEGGQTTSVQFSCNVVQTSSISGSVTNTDGTPRANASVTITRTAPAGGSAVTVTTGSNGQYSLTGLRSGTYTVSLATTANCTTAATNQTVSLSAGESRVVNFVCTVAPPPPPGDPATVAIQTVTRSNALGVPVPVPLQSLNGVINVTLGIDEGAEDVTRYELSLGGREVCQQTFAAGSPEGMQLATFDVLCVINTADFSRETGVPFFLNGQNLPLQVEIFTASGGTTPVFTATESVGLTNADIVYAQVVSEQQVLSDNSGALVDNTLLRAGDQTFRVLPVMYSGNQLQNVTLSVTGNVPSTTLATYADGVFGNGAAGTVTRVFSDDVGTPVSGPFSVTLSGDNSITSGNGATASNRGVGNVESQVTITIGTQRLNGVPGPGIVAATTVCSDGTIPVVAQFPPTGCEDGQPANAYLLDTFAPVVGQFHQAVRWSTSYARRPPTAPAEEIAAGITMWVGADHEFSADDGGMEGTPSEVRVEDEGSGLGGGDFFSYQAGTSTAAMTDVESPSELVETFDRDGNNIFQTGYFLSIEVEDVAGNERTRFFDGSDDGTGTSNNNLAALLTDPQGRFGVDLTDPLLNLLNTTPALHLAATGEVVGAGNAIGSGLPQDGTLVQSSFLDPFSTTTPAASPSGFPTNPILTSIERFAPGLTSGQRCVAGDLNNSGVCRVLGTQDDESGTTGTFDFTNATTSTVDPLTGQVRNYGPGGVPPFGYYEFFYQATDAAGNLSPALERVFVLDNVAPIAGGVSFPTVASGGSTVQFTAPVSDDLDLDRAEFFFVFGGQGEAFRTSVQSIGAFGSAELTTAGTASATTPFIYSLQEGTAGAPMGPTQGLFHVFDFGRNMASVNSAGVPVVQPAVALRNYTVGAASMAITAGSERLASNTAFVCWDTDSNGCATNPNTATLSFSVQGAGSQAVGGPLQNPFVSLEFMAGLDYNNDGVVDQSAGAQDLWTRLAQGAVSVSENPAGTVRTYTWTTTVTAEQLAAAAGRTTNFFPNPNVGNDIHINVLGRSADGAGFTMADGAGGTCSVVGGVPTTCTVRIDRN